MIIHRRRWNGPDGPHARRTGNDVARTLVVTGASRGIGAAIAIAGAQAGFAVAVHFGRHAEEADAVVAAIRSGGGTAITVCAELGREADIVRLFETVDEKLGRVDALVNNAGAIVAVTPIADIDTTTVDRILSVNLAGPIYCCREAVRRMSQERGGKGGAIVNISSMAAVLGGLPNEVHYAATKGAIDSLTVGLAREVARQGIRVNAIRPGVVDTPIHASHGEGFVRNFSPSLPMGRAGQPEEIASAAIWLLSDAASYVTGSILNVSGGR
jgi:NAD(P)-dependent dehydrogenase (short-subunit alcohol dehydrogenase family)